MTTFVRGLSRLDLCVVRRPSTFVAALLVAASSTFAPTQVLADNAQRQSTFDAQFLQRMRDARTVGGALRWLRPVVSSEMLRALEDRVAASGPRARDWPLIPTGVDDGQLVLNLSTRTIKIAAVDAVKGRFVVGEREMHLDQLKSPEDLLAQLGSVLDLESQRRAQSAAVLHLLSDLIFDSATAQEPTGRNRPGPPAVVQEGLRALITTATAVLAPGQHSICLSAIELATNCEGFVANHLNGPLQANRDGAEAGRELAGQIRSLAQLTQQVREQTFSNTRNGIRQNCSIYGPRGQRPVADRLNRCIQRLNQQQRALEPLGGSSLSSAGQSDDPIGALIERLSAENPAGGGQANEPASAPGSGPRRTGQ